MTSAINSTPAHNVHVKLGDTLNLAVIFRDSNGHPIDKSSDTVTSSYWTTSDMSGAADGTFAVDDTNEATGDYVVTIPDSMTVGIYYARVKSDTGGDGFTYLDFKVNVSATWGSGSATDQDTSIVIKLGSDTVVVSAAGVAGQPSTGAILHTDIIGDEGFVRKTGAETYIAVKANMAAVVDPTTAADTTAGYVVGSRWVNLVSDAEFVCLDNSVSAAVWKETTGSGGDEFADDVFRIQDNSDATKEIAFQASGITTATTRTITMPDEDVDLGKINAMPYDIRTGFIGVPTTDQIVDTIPIPRAVTFAADLAGSVGEIGINPTSSFVLSIEDDSTEIATVTISTGGAFTFATTSGTEKVVAAGSILTFIAPTTVDATAAEMVMVLAGTT